MNPWLRAIPLVPLALCIAGQAHCGVETGVVIHEPGAVDGYTLMDDTLVDMDGNVVHSWDGVSTEPTKLLSTGNILAGRGSVSTVYLDWESSEVVEQDWWGQTLWQFSEWDPWESDTLQARQHHDLLREGIPSGYWAPGFEHVPGGRTLVLAHQNYVRQDISGQELLDDVIYEVDGEGQMASFVWKAADHVEDFGFSEAARAAIHREPSDPEAEGEDFHDWLHTNSLTTLGPNRHFDAGDDRFHPDNLMISSRNASFIAIIDRQSEAIVWRVGPDYSEGQPEHSLGQICGQHHAHMIPWGLPGAGNILVFDNGFLSGYGDQACHRGYSRALEFDPISLEPVWEYGEATGGVPFFNTIEGSVQRLPGGNTLIGASLELRTFEVTPEGQIVWELRGRHAYRAIRVPPEWLPEGTNPAGYAPWGPVPLGQEDPP